MTRKINKFSFKLGVFIFLGLVIVYGLTTAFDINRWIIISKIPKTQRREIKAVIKIIADLPYLLQRLAPQTLATYELFVDERNLAKLEKFLPQDDTAIFEAENMPYVKARFIADGKEYQVKIKYRGTTSQHWSYAKKSIRIKFEDPGIFHGTSEINLSVPESRGYIMEAFNNYRAGKLGLPFFKDGFVNLKINDGAYSTYYFTEGVKNEFINDENNLTSDFNVYGEKTWNKDLYKDITAWKKYAANSNEDDLNFGDLQRFLDILNTPNDAEFNKKIGTILNLDNFYAWNIHSLLSGSFHQDSTHNARLYYDTKIGKFKFIPWQVLGWPEEDFKDLIYNPMAARILKNPAFLEERNRRLYAYVSDPKNLEEDLAAYDEIMRRVKWDMLGDTKAQEHISTMIDSINNYRKIIEDNFNFILNEYLKTIVENQVTIPSKKNRPIIMDIGVTGQSPVILEGITIKNFDNSNKGFLEVYFDANTDKIFNKGDRFLGIVYLGKSDAHRNFFRKPLRLLSEIDYSLDDTGKVTIVSFRKKTYRIFLINRSREENPTKDPEIELNLTNAITSSKLRKSDYSAQILKEN